VAGLWRRLVAADDDRRLDRLRPPAGRCRRWGCVVASAIAVLRADTRRRVKLAVAVALLVYPAQAGLGAIVATTGGTDQTSAIHLLAGVTIFGSLLAALTWWLEAETGDPDDVAEWVA